MPLSIGNNMNYLQVSLVVKKQFLTTYFKWSVALQHTADRPDYTGNYLLDMMQPSIRVAHTK